MESEQKQGATEADLIHYDRQLRAVMGLRMSAFLDTDLTRVKRILERLAQEEEKLRVIEPKSNTAKAQDRVEEATPVGNLLGALTTQLEVSVTLCMHPVPTGIYHLLTPESDPLLKAKVKNVSRDRRRVRVRVGFEGLSAESVRTVELSRAGPEGAEVTLSFLPTFLPGVVERMNEVQRATIYVISEDLDNKIEAHNTYPVLFLSRNSSFNSVLNPSNGSLVDFTHYYGAWVTPYDELVQERIRFAASLLNPPQIWGYQGEPKDVDRQVEALFLSLQQHGMKYVNSVIDYGAPAGYFTQRTRLPRESLLLKSANCIDGTVLMASLLEGASLNPTLALIPGHAFVGWETWDGSEQWRFIETTMMGEAKFEDACQSGQEEYNFYSARKRVHTHLLRDLRQRGIWPMV